ncbi:MAG: hypothetical protein ABUS48_06165 [Pseudomonadota bacterium]
MLRAVSVYCAIVAAIFAGELFLALVPRAYDILSPWVWFYVGLWGWGSATWIGLFLLGWRGLLDRRKDIFRGCPTWVGIALVVLSLIHFFAYDHGLGLGVNVIPTALFVAIHVSGARVWGSASGRFDELKQNKSA